VVRTMLERAENHGDGLTIHALETIPERRREEAGIFVSDMDEIRALYWAAARPTEMALIDTIKSAQQTYRSNIQSARKDVEARAGVAAAAFVTAGV